MSHLHKTCHIQRAVGFRTHGKSYIRYLGQLKATSLSFLVSISGIKTNKAAQLNIAMNYSNFLTRLSEPS